MKNVIAIVRLMLTPISAAASRSAAVERIARPVRVRDTNSWSATIMISAVAMMNRLRTGIFAPPIVTKMSVGKIWGSWC